MSESSVPKPIDRRETVRVVQRTAAATLDAAGAAEHAHGERIVYDAAAVRRQILHRVSQLVWLLVVSIEILIGLRFVLKLIAANPAHPFARAVYSASELFVAPFRGLTPVYTFGGSELESHTLITMAIYTLLTWVVVRLVWLLFDRPAARSVSTYQEGISAGDTEERRAA